MNNNLEEDCVLKFYKNNADAFTQNRNTPWMPVRSFLSQYWKLGMITLDYGCGNGRNIPREGVGIDITKELLYNYTLNQSLVHCDGISLPFKNESFDLILNVAVIQHFYHHEKREKALKECYKVLKTGGKSLITVTSFEYQKKIRHKKIGENDILVYSKRINEYLIYHHLFSEEELVCLVESVGFVVLEMGTLDNNVYVIVEK